MPEVKKLCLEAAKAAFPSGRAAILRPILFASVDGRALTTLTANAPPNLQAADVESALASFPWILHVQACTVSKWLPPSSRGSSPEAALAVDCYSASGRWRMVVAVRKDQLELPIEFREILEVHPLSAWHFLTASDNDEMAHEVDWAQHAHQQRALLEEDPLKQLESQFARSTLRLNDLRNNHKLALRFSPIVAFDFAKHSAAGNLEAIGSLASGRTNPIELLSKLSGSAATLRKAHCEALLGRLLSKLSKAESAKVAGLMMLPASEVLKHLGRYGSLPEAKGLAYWATSFDHDPDGLSFSQVAKAFKVPTKVFEDGLAQTPLCISGACPTCASDTQFHIHRLSLGKNLLTFSMLCETCGHQEELHRDGTWTKGPLSCSCVTCVKYQREASAVHLPRVAIALEDAVRAAPGLASKSVHAMVQRIATFCEDWDDRGLEAKNPLVPSEWDNKNTVYLELDRDDDPTPVHFFEAEVRVGPFGVGTLDETVQVVSSLGPTNVRYLERTAREGEDPTESFAYLPACLALLLEGDSLAPSESLREWAKALKASGLLCSDSSKFEKLVLMPYGWLTCDFSSSRQQEIEMREDLVVRCEVPKAEALALSVRDTILNAAVSSTYAEEAVEAGYAAAPEHGRNILEQASAIQVPVVQAVLQHLARGSAVTIEALRAARDALKRDRDTSALFYASLLWNYSHRGTGWPNMPLSSGKLAVFSSTTIEAARKSYSLTAAIACRRCSSKSASLTFWGASESLSFWRVECKECGHWEESYEFSYHYRNRFCDCQHCANAASVALKGKSTASLVSELISHCVVEAHALSSKPAGAVISEEANLCDLIEDAGRDEKLAALVKQNAAKATWKPLRYNTSVGLFRHLLPGYSFDMPPMQSLALLAENRSPTMSRAVYRAFLRLLPLLDTRYQERHLRFRLPLCIVLPDGTKEPKVPKRSARQAE
jgi:hypothetical protein